VWFNENSGGNYDTLQNFFGGCSRNYTKFTSATNRVVDVKLPCSGSSGGMDWSVSPHHYRASGCCVLLLLQHRAALEAPVVHSSMPMHPRPGMHPAQCTKRWLSAAPLRGSGCIVNMFSCFASNTQQMSAVRVCGPPWRHGHPALGVVDSE
jgi:hypothetical protein